MYTRLSIKMGRSIPSFRQLIEIERLSWSGFKNRLHTKEEKVAFDFIFGNARLYTQYLSNASRPVPLEPIVMGALFHNYKTLLEMDKEDMESEESTTKKLILLERQCPIAKVLFDKTCERWHGLLYSLHKEDRELLLKMLVECCQSLNECTAKTVMDTDSESSMSFLFFLCLVMVQQKLISRMENVKGKSSKTEVTLLDFM